MVREFATSFSVAPALPWGVRNKGLRNASCRGSVAMGNDELYHRVEGRSGRWVRAVGGRAGGLRLQKLLQDWQQVVIRIACPALPDHKHRPACGLELLSVSAVAGDVVGTFFSPEFRVRGGCDFTEPAAVAVPEAAVDEDHLAMDGQHKIWFPGQATGMQTEAKAHAVNRGTNDQFRLRVFGRDTGHVERPLFRVVDIRHLRVPG